MPDHSTPRSMTGSKSGSRLPKTTQQGENANAGAVNAASNYPPQANLQVPGNVANGRVAGAANVNSPNAAHAAGVANGGYSGSTGGHPQQQPVNNSGGAAQGGGYWSSQSVRDYRQPESSYAETYPDSFNYNYGDLGRLDTLVGYGSGANPYGSSNNPYGSNGGYPSGGRRY